MAACHTLRSSRFPLPPTLPPPSLPLPSLRPSPAQPNRPREITQLLLGRKVDLHAKDSRGLTPMHLTNNRRCKERLREAERREEKAKAEQKKQAEKRKREKALKKREQELLERVDYRSRVFK